MEDEDYYEEDNSQYITRESAKPDNHYHSQEFSCPNCGSYNTGQSTYADYCNSCDWGQGY
jgi:predicted RNA-binding Zn-ribbon protein involved in translation (DUF1610 family)